MLPPFLTSNATVQLLGENNSSSEE